MCPIHSRIWRQRSYNAPPFYSVTVWLAALQCISAGDSRGFKWRYSVRSWDAFQIALETLSWAAFPSDMIALNRQETVRSRIN